MRYSGILFLVAAIGFGAVKGGEFSGTWRMDTTRSESAHWVGPMEESTIVIEMSDGQVTTETTRNEPGKPTSFHEKLVFKLDGSETSGIGEGGASVTGKARWEGGKLVLETVRNINDSTVSTSYVYSLSPDGKSMTIDKTLTVQHGYQGKTGSNTGKGKDIFLRVNAEK